MLHPVFEALKRGERLPVQLLVQEQESLRLFWDWWWQQAPQDRLTRPYTVQDDEPWLQPTMGKELVDTETYREYLSAWGRQLQEQGLLRRGVNVPREDYRQDLLEHVVSKATELSVPSLVMTGGGYGAGKTTATDFMVRTGRLPIAQGSMTGVDYFKAYLPEFCLMQYLADGRASTIVQEESRLLADSAFGILTEGRKSFGWDSSMSNGPEVLKKLERAKEKGYTLWLVAVCAPLDIAIRQSLARAKSTRRFSHPDVLEKSHTEFRRWFQDYVPLFDNISVFANMGTLDANGRRNSYLIAEKLAPNGSLAILENDLFSSLLGT